MSAAFDPLALAERSDGAHASVHAAVVDRGVVVPLVHDRDAHVEVASACGVEERQREVHLGGARRLYPPRDRGGPVRVSTAAWTLYP